MKSCAAPDTLTENEIRPDHLMRRAFELLEEDTRRLMEDSHSFVEVPCPACGSDGHEFFCSKRGMQFVRCLDCGTGYGNPRPDPERLERYYQEATYYEYWNQKIYPQSEEARRSKIFKPRVQRILEIFENYGVESGTLLEVGAGTGIFCEEMQRTGRFKNILAVEPTPSSAESCRRRGLHVIQEPMEKVKLSSKVQVIAAFEVLEHLFSPTEFIKSCADHLQENGLLVLTCPNLKGFDVSVLKEAADYITPEHLNYFHPASMELLIRSAGLEPLEITTPGKLDAEIVRKKVIAGKHKLQDNCYLKTLLFDEWDRVGQAFQQFLADNQLSSHMWTVARKPSMG